MRIFHNTKIWVTVFNNRLPGEFSNFGKSGTLKKKCPYIYIYIYIYMYIYVFIYIFIHIYIYIYIWAFKLYLKYMENYCI